MNNNRARGLNGLMTLVLCIFLAVGVYWAMHQAQQEGMAYTWQDFREDLTEENIEDVEIRQNRVAPTGTLRITLDNDTVEQLHVSDVNEVQDILDEYGLDYRMSDVPQDTWVTTTLVPLLLMGGVVILMFVIMSRQGGANSRAMNFG